ncbi:hypothetical protein ACFV1A_02500 [Streptomyces seoulensis]|uniref:Uncharacterized protein n=1 Tax=Streptomyces seoulensis TaxID=73044 RepID=A0A4P6U2H4_STRSO|nr:hypothetical protein [Streptomyces seoulensis]QBJ93204.1 hypothetical protein D0Z67_24880 [Streptomyces seoulensis]
MVLSSLSRSPHGRLLHAERRLAERYTELVRLAYLVLPASLGRHRRVLAAHSLVQRSLPDATPAVPAPRVPGADPDRSLRVAVVRGALAQCRRPRLWPEGTRPPRLLVPRLPVVLGLRLAPRSGGAEEMALGQALSDLSAPARAAFVLLRVEGLTADHARGVLEAAGVANAQVAVRQAARLDASLGAAAGAVLTSDEFDACTLRARPTDLVRRRRRVRLAALAVLAGALTVGGLAAVTHSAPDTSETSARKPRSADLVRVGPGEWADTSRVDFTAWPARGDRVRDRALLDRALAVWADPPSGTRVDRAPGTPADPPPRAPRLLYAGSVGGHAVVVFHDGQRLVRYAESGTGERLSLARVDDADVTTAAAVVLDERGGAVRYLLAPWVAESSVRDLTRPDSPARPLSVARDGVTAPVPRWTGGGCGRRPALQLRSSPAIAEHHAFLLADLGGLTPAHLTYTPLPGHGSPPARQPREATGPAALVAWGQTGCDLDSAGGPGVRAVNAWDFAEQDLPDGGGHAVWTCARADTWQGPGNITVSLRRPGEDAQVVTRVRSTAVCSRFGRHVVARTHWKSPRGHWYVLAAGSRHITSLALTGDVRATRDGHTLAVRAPKDASTQVRARLTSGETLPEVGSGPSGGTRP